MIVTDRKPHLTSKDVSSGTSDQEGVPAASSADDGLAPVMESAAFGLAEQIATEIAGGRTTHVPFGSDDIGSELLAILSQGLYDDPRDALREYIQNSVDAQSKDVWITLEGRKITIRDEGCGMDLNALLDARKVAKSAKLGSRLVGFRGIGIYSAMNVCERLHIETQTAHSDVRYKLTFEFGEMNRILDEHRRNPIADDISLAAMLTACTLISESEVNPTECGMTLVTLEDVKAEKYRELRKTKSLEAYLLRNVPVGINPESTQFRAINAGFAANEADYRTINVHVKDEVKNNQIYATLPDALNDPEFYPIKVGGKLAAIIWVSSSKKKERLLEGGLVFKMRGFTIGDRDTARPYFTRKEQTYRWLYGEIHIIDSDVRPNAARNDFERDPAWKRLSDALKDELRGIGDKMAREWALVRAKTMFDRLEPEIVELQATIKRGVGDGVDAFYFAHVERLRELLNKQRLARTTDFDVLRQRREKIFAILKQCEGLLKVNRPGRSPGAVQNGASRLLKGHAAVTVNAQGRDLIELFTAAGLKLTPSQQKIVRLIGDSLDEAFQPGSSERARFEDSLGRHLLAT